MTRLEIAALMMPVLFQTFPADYAGQPESVLAHDALIFADALIEAAGPDKGFDIASCPDCGRPNGELLQIRPGAPFQAHDENCKFYVPF